MAQGALLIVVNKKGKVLLQHKDAGAPLHANKWCLFGGGIEAGENAQQAIHREFIEELEWQLHECIHFGKYSDNDAFYTHSNKSAEALRPKLHEGSDLGYFSKQEIMSMNIAEPHLEILKDYFSAIQPLKVHFICRGNACRSIIAEAYLKSLRIKGLTVMSSGSVALANKDENKLRFEQICKLLNKHGLEEFTKHDYGQQLTQGLLDESDVVVCVNRLVFNDVSQSFKLPPHTIYWNITDIGEMGRITTSDEELVAAEEAIFNEVKREVDKLVATRIRL